MPKDDRPHSEIEAAVQLAVQAIRANPAAKISTIAKNHGAPLKRVRNRLNGIGSKSDRPAPNRLLQKWQEDVVRQWIRQMDAMGIGCRVDYLSFVVDEVLAMSHNDASVPVPKCGGNWVRRWLAANPDITVVVQTTRHIDRAVALYKEDAVRWFRKLRGKMDEHGIQTGDIWNVDEIGFRIGVGGDQYVVSYEEKSVQKLPASETRLSISVIECVSADGFTIDPTIILPGKTQLQYFFDNGLTPNTQIGMSEKGMSNDVLGYEWIKHFDRSTRATRRGRYRLLLLDGHGSHLTVQFAQYCGDNDIIVFAFPPHATHLMQPLDLKVFSPFKKAYKRGVDIETRLGNANFSKGDFLNIIQPVRARAFRGDTIRSAFRHAGIAPWDPDVVVSQCPPTPEPQDDPNIPSFGTPPPPSSSPTATPRCPRTFDKMAESVKRDLDQLGTPVPDRLVEKFQKLRDGGLTGLGMAKFASATMTSMTAHAKRKAERDGQRKQTWKGGMVDAHTGRAIGEERMEEVRQNEEKRARVEEDLASRRIMYIEQGLPVPQHLLPRPTAVPVRYGKPKTFTRAVMGRE